MSPIETELEPSSSALDVRDFTRSIAGAAGTTGVVTVSVTGVGTWSETTEAVLTMSPPASADVTT